MIARLAHYAVRAADLEASSAFYAEVLGLRAGPRPPFGFPGVWFYMTGGPADQDQGCVHLIGSGQNDALSDYLGDGVADCRSHAGALDHIAFLATDWPAFRERLERSGTPYIERFVPLLGMRQTFVKDPDGVTVELNFPAKF